MKWTRIERSFALPDYVREALQKLDDAGHVAYVVGGSVRDLLIGRTPKDHDIATSATPDEIAALFPGSIEVGKHFGVIKIPIRAGSGAGALLEIATFRKDLEYRNHRHPTGVRFAGPEEDAQRRDFTVNGLFLDPKTQRILDCVGGMEDIARKIVRAIGRPEARFEEDALRLVRAARFATTLGFELDLATARAAREKAHLIARISPERVREELTLMLTGNAPAEAVRTLSDLGLLSYVIPELEGLKGLAQSPLHHPEGDVWSHTLRVLEELGRAAPARGPSLSWAALLHDVGKPEAYERSEGRNFNGHEIDGARLARAACSRLRMSKDDTDRVALLVAEHLKFKDVFQMREATLERWVREPHFPDLLELHRADSLASDGDLAAHEYCEARLRQARSREDTGASHLIDGEDLIQLGMSPGPRFAKILKTIEDLALENKLRTKQEALEYVVKHFVD